MTEWASWHRLGVSVDEYLKQEFLAKVRKNNLTGHDVLELLVYLYTFPNGYSEDCVLDQRMRTLARKVYKE